MRFRCEAGAMAVREERLEARQRADLVSLHESAVSDHVGGQDSREPAGDVLPRHAPPDAPDRAKKAYCGSGWQSIEAEGDKTGRSNVRCCPLQPAEQTRRRQAVV